MSDTGENLQEENEKLQQRVYELQSKISGLETNHNKQLASLKQEIDQLRNEVENEADKVVLAQKTNVSISDKFEKLKAEYDKTKNEKVLLETENKRLERELQIYEQKQAENNNNNNNAPASINRPGRSTSNPNQGSMVYKSNNPGIFWQADTSSRGCTVCNIVFSVTVRRHHCRLCGSLVCDHCSPKVHLVQYGGPKFPSQRTCRRCLPAAMH